jgi:uncharacterized protein (DUF169 family)
MSELAKLESKLQQSLGLSRRPVAISFLNAPPAGVPKFTGTVPSGCTFWRMAGEGQRFYTVPADHYNCPIGSHTHSIALPAERQNELSDTLSLMGSIGYIRMEEVGGIPILGKQPEVISYSPLGEATATPDVVILVGKAGKMMLLMEAATRAGVSAPAPLMGRPTCMAVPAAMQGGVVGSTGCIGNRVYTDMGDGDFYVTVKGSDIEKLASELDTIVKANGALKEYHEGRKATLSSN